MLQRIINRCYHFLETIVEQNSGIWVISLFLPLIFEFGFHRTANVFHGTIQDIASGPQSTVEIQINIMAFRAANGVHAMLQSTVDVLQDRFFHPGGQELAQLLLDDLHGIVSQEGRLDLELLLHALEQSSDQIGQRFVEVLLDISECRVSIVGDGMQNVHRPVRTDKEVDCRLRQLLFDEFTQSAVQQRLNPV